ncbi:Oxidoreductase, molybdopterin-binding domain-containing protein [Gilbertella persicaria]|uniref:Oxidoreductase, molybdopterin-binding domain-containing protein n=1 Tax=Gilbertella persicaria TaxID=101096 RepID=UPI002220E253|nr:Oxidoreductase, molybdopterin-binding domain-containing protein [Gilbertella persicaria]KAI8072246.1 Oxidoreductase, molybdopterin-binding domain-containing protein [Gilbertella persicaria]
MSQLDYSKDPKHDSLALIVRKDAPYNAEPAPIDLVKNYITPEKYFFCRNHGPLPDIKEQEHTILVQGIGCKTPTLFSMKELKENYEKHSVMMAMQCAGNRRDGLHKVKHTKGVIWGPCALGNAIYSGCRLRDVLATVGVTTKIKNLTQLHVSFESVEQCEEDKCYGSSVPLSKALDEFGDVLLAYEMNYQTLSRDHGFPIRVVVPGYIGGRSVKYLKSITIQDYESMSFYQRRDYKILPENISNEDQANEYWCKVPSIGEYNVQSYVCNPADGIHSGGNQNQIVQGYALSGGGRSIQRVDVSGDDGRTWITAQLHQPAAEHNNCRVWGWCLWTATVTTKRNVRIVSRAVDSSGNVQQEYPVWNYRGVMNNSWRTVEPNTLEMSNI